jgi:Carboxypeptidase regulatory-like domain
MTRTTLLRLAGALALFVTCSLAAFAQVSSTSAISGSVTDPSGAVVPNTTVTIRNSATGAEFKATTAENGTFSVPALTTGTYSVTFLARGFKQAIVEDVKLDAGSPSTVNVVLEIGAQSESVVVQGASEVLQTQSANISTTITGRQITDLPFTSRDALDLVLLLPGTSTPGRPRTSTVNGLPKGALNISLDGINVQDNTLKSSDGFFTYIRARIDAVDEVTLSTATPGAESSGEGAVQLKFVTRSGNNEFHGSVYEYHRNPALNANYWFNNRDLPPNPATGHADKARILLNQYGFRLGGPISIPKVFSGKDRAFFFVNYEEYRLPEQTTRQRTILNPLTQQGIFQYNSSSGVQQVNLLQLAAKVGCSGCTTTLDPTVSKLLADIRSSTGTTGAIQPLTDPNLQRFTFTNVGGQNRYFPTVRLDFNLSSKHHLENIYNYNKFGSKVDFLNNVDPAFPGFPNHASQISNRFSNSTALRSTLTPTLVNEARFGFTGGTVLFFPEPSVADFNGPVANQQGFNLSLSGTANTANATGLTNATVTNAPSRRNAPVWQIQDTVNWTRGAHSFSFGGSFTQVNFWAQAQNLVPSVNFGIDSTDPANVMFTSGNFPGAAAADITRAAAIYAVLTGHITAINSNARLDETTGKYVFLGSQTERDRQREMGFFAQDSWRVRPNLTLTGGLRWEVQFPFATLNSVYAQNTFDSLFGVSGPGNIFKPGTLTGTETMYTQFKPGDRAYNTDYANVAPSVGFAWSPNFKGGVLGHIFGESGQTVLRGGYSMAFDREGMNVVSSILGGNPGILITTNRDLSLGNLGTLPVLLRETNRLGPPSFPSAPVYPNSGLVTDSANAFNPNLQLGYVQSWSVGVQREINKDTVLEVRYVANRGVKLWDQYNLNETNLVENGFLNEFKLAQANLLANIAAGRGSNFRYSGPGTGTSPLPIILANFSGKVDPNVASSYASSNFASATFVNPLAINGPLPTTFANSLIGNATFRGNAVAAGLPANLFRVNPGKLGGAFSIENNGRTYYDAAVVEVRRRLSHGLLIQGSYAFAKALTNIPVSSSVVNYQPRTLRNMNLDKTVSPFGITHALKMNWIYELPFGRGQALLGNAGGIVNQLVGGWEFHGTARLQSGSPNGLGNVQLVGMTRNDLQEAVNMRFDDANKIAYFLPQDIVDNTIRANNVSATSATGYGALGVPTGRYIAPASGKNCIEGYAAQCGTSHLMIYGPRFTRFDLSAVKKFKITERVNFEFRAEFLNAFNNINFLLGSAANDTQLITNFSSSTFGQVTNAYQDTSTTNDPGGRMIQFVARINF